MTTPQPPAWEPPPTDPIGLPAPEPPRKRSWPRRHPIKYLRRLRERKDTP
jgi:hypothetical protein